MSRGLPRWSVALLRALSPPGEIDDVLGDLDEARRHRLRRRGGSARLATAIDTLDMAMALVRARIIRARIHGTTMMQDCKLGLRMLSVGMLACIAPARRALRIQPIDALKES